MLLFPFWLLVLIFLAAVGAIWVAGTQLSRYTDVLAERLHLGAALGGLILLAITTNLPELAITVSAAMQGDLSIAVRLNPPLDNLVSRLIIEHTRIIREGTRQEGAPSCTGCP